MGKRRKQGNVKEKKSSSMEDRTENSDNLPSELLDPTDRSFIYDEVDDFMDDRDLVSLQTAEKMMERRKAPREQVLALEGSSSDDEDDDDDDDDLSKDSDDNPDELYMEDDIVDEPKLQVPDERAWGNRKNHYFGTDTTDEKIKWNIYNQDEEMAQLEEKTARELQERMAAELKDLVSDDLILQVDQKENAKDASSEDLVETDVSSLSRSRKLQLLKRESPEFLPLVEDLKSKCEELRCILGPLMTVVNDGKVPEGPVRDYVTTKYRVVLNYVSTVTMYMLVKCSTKSVREHPVVGRLAQYRQLLKELEPCDNKLASHLGKLLRDNSEQNESTIQSPSKEVKDRPRKRKKELEVLRKSKSAKIEERKRLMSLLKDPVESKDKNTKNKSKLVVDEMYKDLETSSDEEQEIAEPAEDNKHELDPNEKRSIGYKIAKNKGLLPYRNKDQRNPRVRYRNKYTKKLKRRKGQVKAVRKELKRYDGEMTGIRSHTIRSVKIKS